ncbi:DoxX family protein [Leptospira fainei serovar Hurstbridge str. BUT 6]|uniref:DoxX family protein n=1 Tax=Leptospira fainei serovar Hurstbridge str. BUT 6 TaxID=1193011 RepID=S3VXH7_9LEPT|nr:DoxX family membrane protein [Leptospira fainei]EPG72832.1 DoxX family protein [Leptospira fainei serovar Hurstbridge str. BUT 6]
MIERIFKTDKDITSFILRIVLAVVFFPHGAQKVLGWFGGYGFSGTLGFFAAQGTPTLLVLLLFAAEFLGPIGLVLGLMTRVAAAGIAVAMSVALLVHIPHGFFINWAGNQQGEGIEFHILAIAISIALLIKGSGWASIDGIIANGK